MLNLLLQRCNVDRDGLCYYTENCERVQANLEAAARLWVCCQPTSVCRLRGQEKGVVGLLPHCSISSRRWGGGNYLQVLYYYLYVYPITGTKVIQTVTAGWHQDCFTRIALE